MSEAIHLPGVLRDIADVAGEEVALAIAAVRGGTQVYIPPRPSPDHWLCRLIGNENALKVCDRLTCGVGPLRVDLPLGPRGHMYKGRAMVDAMLAENRSERDIALATGYTIRGVRRRRKRIGRAEQTNQLSLF